MICFVFLSFSKKIEQIGGGRLLTTLVLICILVDFLNGRERVELALVPRDLQ